MIEQKKQWLSTFSWDAVLSLNRSLCQAQKVEPLMNPKTAAKAKEFWDRSASQTMTLAKAFEVCRQAFEMSPCMFNNGNTFAAVGRTLVDNYLQAAPPVEGQIIRTTIGHYIAGTIERKELIQVLEHFAHVLKPVPVVIPDVAPAAPEAPEPVVPPAPPAANPAVRLSDPRAAV